MSAARQLFYTAIQEGNLDKISELLDEGLCDPNEAITEDGDNPLMVAARCNQLGVIGLLLRKRADPYKVSANTYHFVELISAFSNFNASRSEIFQLIKENGYLDPSEYNQLNKNILKLIRQVGYPTHPAGEKGREGLCRGLATVAIDYIMRGQQGILDLKEILKQFGLQNVETLKKKIEDAEEARLAIVKREKQKLSSSIERIVQLDRPGLYISEDKLREIIDGIIKDKFTDTTKEERVELVEILIRLAKGEETEKTVEKSFIDLFRSIQTSIRNKVVNAVIQQTLDKIVKKELGKDFIFLEMRNYIESVALSHNEDLYPDYFDENLRSNLYLDQGSVIQSIPLISSSELEKKELIKVGKGNFFGSYKKKELEDIFAKLREEIGTKGIKCNVIFHITAGFHAFMVVYDPAKDRWILYNYSSMYIIGHNELEYLAEVIIHATPLKGKADLEKGNPSVLMSVETLCAKDDCAAVDVSFDNLERNEEWKKLHAFTPEKLAQNVEQVATYSSATEKVKELIRHQSIFQRVASNWKNLSLLQKSLMIAGIVFTFPAIILGSIYLLPVFFWVGIAALTLIVAVNIWILFLTPINSPIRYAEISKNIDEQVEANRERDARYPSTSRYRISQALASDDEVVSLENIDEKTPLNSEKRSGGGYAAKFFSSAADKKLFTKDHEHYLELQDVWKKIWDENTVEDGTDKDFLKSMKGGCFNDDSKLLGWHQQNYEAIEGILKLKFDPNCYKSDLVTIHLELTKMKKSPTFNQHMPRAKREELEKLSQLVGQYLAAKNLSQPVVRKKVTR